MKYRYNKLLFGNEEGLTFEVKVPNGKIIKLKLSVVDTISDIHAEFPTVLAGEYAEEVSVYTDKDGNKAVIPKGWTVSGVPNENVIFGKDIGMVIYYIPKEKVSRIDWNNKKRVNTLMKTYNQLVWKPVNMLSATHTLDGKHFNEKLGRMNYRNEKFSESEYYEELERELAETKKSIDQYGGCYITRYKISKDKRTGEPRSVKGAYPWTDIDFPTARQVAASMAKSENFKSHLTYGAEYDTRLKWAIETGTVTKKEVVKDSTRLGNYYNNENYPDKIVKTGEDGCVNNIYGFAGNLRELTQEKNNELYCVIRGGIYYDYGGICPVAYRLYDYPINDYSGTGFRATFYLW